MVLENPTPVILDAYADWCGPCKQLTPVLERVVRAQGGKVLLAKLNVDNEAQLAGGLGIQSIPAVFGLAKGKLVERFEGNVPEAKVTEFVQKVAKAGGAPADASAEAGPTPTELLASGNESLAAGNAQEAAAAFQAAHKAASAALAPHLEAQAEARAKGQSTPAATQQALTAGGAVVAVATAGLARAALVGKDLEAAQNVVAMLRKQHPEHVSHPEVAKAIAEVDLSAHGAGSGDDEIETLRTAVHANAGDLDAHLSLARALSARGMHEEAVNAALEVIKRDPGHADGAAREFLITTFNALGPQSEVTKAGRARLANFMYR